VLIVCLGSWRNPPPGTPVKGEPDDEHRLGQKVTDLDDKIARENFRVVVIKPEEVERLDLSDPATGRRWKYTLNVETGEWSERVCWP
jgi:pyridoxamine 5'-phosphate oxidase